MTTAAYRQLMAATPRDRLDLFLATANRLGAPVSNVEKDFWVCWTLNALYRERSAEGPRLLFKGGTSLSKAYGLVKRFSEDIDITVFRDDLDQPASVEELESLSNKKRRARLDTIRDACRAYITGPLREFLDAQLADATDGAGRIEIDDRQASKWERAWQAWWTRHALRAAREGGLFPDVVFRRLRDWVEVSWGSTHSETTPYRFDIAEAPQGGVYRLCHLLFDQEEGRRLAIASGPWAPRDIEQRANAFAAMLLMPTSLVQRTVARLTQPLKTAKGVSEVAGQLQVGRSSVLSHLTNLGYIDESDKQLIEDDLYADP